ELEHPHAARRRGVDAQAAQHALVDVLLHDPQRAVVAHGVDVHGTYLGQLGGHGRVARDLVVDLDPDEQSVGPHAGAPSPSLARTRSGISSMRSATVIPASASRAI